MERSAFDKAQQKLGAMGKRAPACWQARPPSVCHVRVGAAAQALEVVVLSFSYVSEAGSQRLRLARPRLLVKAWRRKTPGF